MTANRSRARSGGVDSAPKWFSRVGAWWQDLCGLRPDPARDRFLAELRERQPRFGTAVRADTEITAARRAERHEFRSARDAAVQAARLALVTDSFFAQCCYRAKAACQRRRIPLLPRLLHRLAVITGPISIGDPVVVAPGVYIPHGYVVVDGMATIGERVTLSPFITIGLVAGEFGSPTIGDRASIGTGARVLGNVRVGNDASVGANAVVLHDVDDGVTVVGAPAHPVGHPRAETDSTS